MPFVVQKSVMTKEVLACMLDIHFIEERPIVMGHDETWLVMMLSDQFTDAGWTCVVMKCLDFDLNVSNELSEERSDP